MRAREGQSPGTGGVELEAQSAQLRAVDDPLLRRPFTERKTLVAERRVPQLVEHGCRGVAVARP